MQFQLTQRVAYMPSFLSKLSYWAAISTSTVIVWFRLLSQEFTWIRKAQIIISLKLMNRWWGSEGSGIRVVNWYLKTCANAWLQNWRFAHFLVAGAQVRLGHRRLLVRLVERHLRPHRSVRRFIGSVFKLIRPCQPDRWIAYWRVLRQRRVVGECHRTTAELLEQRIDARRGIKFKGEDQRVPEHYGMLKQDADDNAHQRRVQEECVEIKV